MFVFSMQCNIFNLILFWMNMLKILHKSIWWFMHLLLGQNASCKTSKLQNTSSFSISLASLYSQSIVTSIANGSSFKVEILMHQCMATLLMHQLLLLVCQLLSLMSTSIIGLLLIQLLTMNFYVMWKSWWD